MLKTGVESVHIHNILNDAGGAHVLIIAPGIAVEHLVLVGDMRHTSRPYLPQKFETPPLRRGRLFLDQLSNKSKIKIHKNEKQNPNNANAIHKFFGVV